MFSNTSSGPRGDAQDASGNLRGKYTQPGAAQRETQSISAKQHRPRLTQADHPSVARITPGLDAEREQADWLASLTTERHRNANQTSGAKSNVLVLNGAACFVAGKLASTGEPQVSYIVDKLTGNKDLQPEAVALHTLEETASRSIALSVPQTGCFQKSVQIVFETHPFLLLRTEV